GWVQTETYLLTGGQLRAEAWCCTALPNGRGVVVGYRDGSVRVFEVPGGACVAVLDEPDPEVVGHGVGACVAGPDGGWIASGHTPGKVEIWDLPDASTARPGPSRRAVFAGHTARVTACATSADGSLLVTGGNDDTARIWVLDAAAVAGGAGEGNEAGPVPA